MQKIYKLYEEIMENEAKLYPDHIPSFIDYRDGTVNYMPEDFYNLSMRVLDIAKSSFVPRGYNLPYGLTDEKFYFESIGSHTNLVTAIITSALDFFYKGTFGNNFDQFPYMIHTIDGYSYREVLEVARLHDLAENETGDLPDNGNRDELLKQAVEYEYIENHLKSYPGSQKEFTRKVLRLFKEMQDQSQPTGTLLYLADKVAAIIITLALDKAGRSPMISSDDPYLSTRDIREIKACDHSYGGKYKASEMWAADYFIVRKIVELDSNLFFTALIVMSTLIVNGHWYSWREIQYLNNPA